MRACMCAYARACAMQERYFLSKDEKEKEKNRFGTIKVQFFNQIALVWPLIYLLDPVICLFTYFKIFLSAYYCMYLYIIEKY